MLEVGNIIKHLTVWFSFYQHPVIIEASGDTTRRDGKTHALEPPALGSLPLEIDIELFSFYSFLP